MASEWRLRRLDELGFVGRGKSRHRPRNDERLYGGSYPFVQTADIMAADPYITSYSQTYSEFGLQQSKMWKPNTLCMTIAGANTARTAILKIEACFPDSVVGFVADKTKADLHFVKYSLDLMKSKFLAVSRGATQDNLSLDKLLSFPLRVPDLAIQQRIGAVLSAYDDLIENNTRRIKILEQMAQILYREWFVSFRFPGHRTQRRTDSELGPIPAGWSIAPLAEQLTVLETGSRPKGGVAEITDGVPSLGAESIDGIGRFAFEKTKFIPTDFFQKMKQGVLEDRDVLVYKDGGQPGNFHPHVSLVAEGFPYSKMAINSHVYRLRTTDRINQDFLYYHLSSEHILDWMRLHGTGAAIPGLARRDLQKLPLLLPPPELARRFEEFAQPLNSLILVIAKRNRILSKTRNFLLPKLVSGEVSVEQIESEAAAQTV